MLNTPAVASTKMIGTRLAYPHPCTDLDKLVETETMPKLMGYSKTLNRVSDRVLAGRKSGIGFSHDDLKASLEAVRLSRTRTY